MWIFCFVNIWICWFLVRNSTICCNGMTKAQRSATFLTDGHTLGSWEPWACVVWRAERKEELQEQFSSRGNSRTRLWIGLRLPWYLVSSSCLHLSDISWPQSGAEDYPVGMGVSHEFAETGVLGPPPRWPLRSKPSRAPSTIVALTSQQIHWQL